MPSDAPGSKRLFSGLGARRAQDTAVPRRFEVTPEEYLKEHKINVYIQDIVQRIGESSGNPSATNPIEATASYFHRVTCGTHVEGRGFEYIAATPYNRRSFVHLVDNTFATRIVDSNVSQASRLNCVDCHALLQLLCLDIPPRIAEEASLGAQAQATLRMRLAKAGAKSGSSGSAPAAPPPAGSSNKWRFSDFLDGLRVTFVYNEFLSLAKTQVFGTVSPYNLQTPTKYMSEIRPIMAALQSEGCEVPPEEVVNEALNGIFEESGKSGLSRIAIFIGSLCNNEVLRAQHRNSKLLASARAAAATSSSTVSAPKESGKRVEITVEPTTVKASPRVRAKSARRKSAFQQGT
mmetsp:Transcript_17445/g.37972  ORF Transcript_17445/g.37972 Transcript_17445/m.37972 type:complete len:349 (-) Transcript_17445:8-1054(-)